MRYTLPSYLANKAQREHENSTKMKNCPHCKVNFAIWRINCPICGRFFVSSLRKRYNFREFAIRRAGISSLGALGPIRGGFVARRFIRPR